jgi:hypothetical protein
VIKVVIKEQALKINKSEFSQTSKEKRQKSAAAPDNGGIGTSSGFFVQRKKIQKFPAIRCSGGDNEKTVTCSNCGKP